MKPLARLGWNKHGKQAAGPPGRPDAPAQPAPAAAGAADRRDRLRRERDRFLGFAFASGSVLIEVQPDGLIAFAAGALVTFLKQTADGLVGRPLSELVAPVDRGALAVALMQLNKHGRIFPLALRLDPEHTSGCSMVLTGCRLPGGDQAMHLSLRPIASGEEVPDRDPASGLLDRSALTRAVHARLGGQASGEQPLLTFLELDGLRALHERLDAEEGERLPRKIGSFLSEASSGGSAAQIAAERFGLLHDPSVRIPDLEVDLAGALREADPLGEGVVPRSMTLPLDVEGLSEPDAAKAIGFMIKRFADGRVGDGTPLLTLRDGFDAMLSETVERLADYRGTLTDDRFHLVFQPIVRLVDERIQYYEVLVRTADACSPTKLLDFAEAIELVDELDLAVCRRAMAILETAAPCLALAVNLSGRSFENPIFVAALLEMLDRAEAVRPRLRFELTETAEPRALTTVNEVIQAIRKRGCKVGLDDFGTGAATFHYLRAFDVDFIKIDGSLIKSTRQRDKVIVENVVALCRDLEIPTVAEMVETRSQAAWLAKLKVTLGQGYLFGKPTPHLGQVADTTELP